jgi:hypothetical protein
LNQFTISTSSNADPRTPGLSNQAILYFRSGAWLLRVPEKIELFLNGWMAINQTSALSPCPVVAKISLVSEVVRVNWSQVYASFVTIIPPMRFSTFQFATTIVAATCTCCIWLRQLCSFSSDSTVCLLESRILMDYIACFMPRVGTRASSLFCDLGNLMRS